MRLRHYLILLITLFLGEVSLVSATDPTNLKSDGIPSNAHVIGLRPNLCWELPPGTTTLDYQVQLDDDPNFNGAGSVACGHPFFWDTGQGTKGTHANDRCVNSGFRSTYTFCYFNADLEYRPTLMYWRVRTLEGSTWSNWVSDSVKLNFPPLWPVSMSAAVDAVASTDSVQTDPNTVASPGTYYVDSDPNLGVDDPNHGSASGTPWRTLQYATGRLVAGDTLNVMDTNIFRENVLIRAGTHQSGNAMHPIIVQKNSGDSPVVVTASSTLPGIAIQFQGVHDWVLDGISAATTAGPGCDASTGTCSAIGINNSNNIVVKNFSYASGYTVPWRTNTSYTTRAIDIWNGSYDIRITNSVFDQSIADGIDVEGGGWGNLTIQGNEFTSASFDPNTPTVGRFIHIHAGKSGNVLVDSNYFHDANPGQACVFNYKASFARYTNNVFYNIGGKNGTGSAVMADRSGPLQFVNNTCYNVQESCVWALKGVGYTDFTNNIVMHSDPNGSWAGKQNSNSLGLLLGSDGLLGTTTRGSIIDNNNFRTLKASALGYIINGSASDPNFLDHAPTGNVTTDPNFLSVDPNLITTNFLRIAAASGALDTGLAATPVPTLGGATRDMGRFERGETNNSMYKIYTYQPEVANLMDTTPKFSWVLRDEDNLLEACCNFLPPGDTDIQRKFQLQIDEATTFNTLSPAHPLIDSGIISSLNEFWTLPDSRALTATKDYYFRVRQSDEEDPSTLGPWSDATWAVGMDDDLEPAAPVMITGWPRMGIADDSVSITNNMVGLDCRGSAVTFNVRDLGGTVDCYTAGFPDYISGTATFYIDGASKPNQNQTGVTHVYPDTTYCRVWYDASGDSYVGFAPGSTHTTRLIIKDNSANSLDTGTITFTCGSPNAPAPPGGGGGPPPKIYRVIE